MTDTEDRETDDIYLAAFYSLFGAEMVSRRRNGIKVWFMFRGSHMAELYEDYYLNRRMVEPCTYSDRIKMYKHLCFG